MTEWYTKVVTAEPPSKRKLAIAAGAGVVLVALVGSVWSNVTGGSGNVVVAAGDATVTAAPNAGVLIVHVVGAVASPGVYEVSPGARVLDAIDSAGGLTRMADSASLNLARTVLDGEQIVVGERGSREATATGAPHLLNINTATVADWETLPRIGPTLAARIVAFRDQHGSFAGIDSLLDVPGIGPLTLEGMRNQLTG